VHRSQIFSTAADGQTQVEIHVLQGERPWLPITRPSASSSWMGSHHSAGVPQVEVSFDIDANGILNVKATDKAATAASTSPLPLFRTFQG